MNNEQLLSRYHFPKSIRDIFDEFAIEQLYPHQEEALAKGILDGTNVVLSLPTASGKTLVAELCMLKTILERKQNCVYIVPLKALASEKYDDFTAKYSRLGIRIGIATGDYDVPNKQLAKYQILIATSEKIDSLLRFRAGWLTENLGTVVLDEVHYLDDPDRGPVIEILTARLRQLNPKIQLLALSATIQNAHEIAGWLGAQLIVSNWRPVPLHEGILLKNRVDFADASHLLIDDRGSDEVTNLVLDTVKEGGQTLVFVNSRRSTQSVARTLAKKLNLVLSLEQKNTLKAISQDIEKASGEPTKTCRLLAEAIRCGVAFHHAGLVYKQRKLIENNFKEGRIKVICSTPTLAAGVNLPARRVIIRDYKRYEEGFGSVPVRVFEYKQCAGRAGRPRYDTSGEAILIAKTDSEKEMLFEHYINAASEPITSKLGTESALRTHILASVSSGYVYDVKGIFEFLSHTFLAYQHQAESLLYLVGKIFDFLEREEMVTRRGFKFHATPFGHCISRLYIDPLTGVVLRNGLLGIRKMKEATPLGLLHLACCCPDSELLKVGSKDHDQLKVFSDMHEWELVNRLDEAIDDYVFYLSTIKTGWMLLDWISEEKEEPLCDRFSIGPGDIRRHVEVLDWLLYSLIEIAGLFESKHIASMVEKLRTRVKYGIKEELLDLVSLRGIGRVRARSLFERGYRRLTHLKKASLEELTKIPHIGGGIAQSVHQQLVDREIPEEIDSV